MTGESFSNRGSMMTPISLVPRPSLRRNWGRGGRGRKGEGQRKTTERVWRIECTFHGWSTNSVQGARVGMQFGAFINRTNLINCTRSRLVGEREMPRKYSTEELVEKAIAKVECDMSIQLKSKQREAIETFVRGSDVFVSLPTGFGKSLCFVLLPLIYDTLRQKHSV